MAFPTIPTVVAGRVLTNTQANNNGTRVFPSLSGLTKNSGDLLIAICVQYQSAASGGAVFSNWSSGWTEFLDVGGTSSNMSIGAAYKYSTGSETGTIQVDVAGAVTGHAGMFLLSIPGAHQSIAPVGGTIVNATGAAANIAALNPSTWGTLDTLWIAVGGSGETATTGSFTGFTLTGPANYTNSVQTGISSDVVGGVDAIVAFRQLNAASEDPGTFAVDTTNARNSAVLIAVAPAAQVVSINPASTTASAQQLSGSTHVKTLTPVSETDSVGVIVPLQTLPASETDTTFSATFPLSRSITPATSTASAQALSVAHAVTITTAATTASAIGLSGSQKFLTHVSETDSALTLTPGHDISPASETDLVGDIVEFQPLPAETTNTAQALSFEFADLTFDAVTETDTAQALSYTQPGGGHLILPVTETDLANQIVSLQTLPASETASAQTLVRTTGGKSITPVSETDSAQTLTSVTTITLPEFEVTAPLPYNSMAVTIGDRSTAVTLSITSGVGSNKNVTPVTETNTAQALVVRKQATITTATSTASAQVLTPSKTYNISTATSTSSAQSITYFQSGDTFYMIDPVGETNTSVTLVVLAPKIMTLGIVVETDTARFARAANRPTGGLTLTDHDPTVGLALIDHTESSDLALIDI